MGFRLTGLIDILVPPLEEGGNLDYSVKITVARAATDEAPDAEPIYEATTTWPRSDNMRIEQVRFSVGTDPGYTITVDPV